MINTSKGKPRLARGLKAGTWRAGQIRDFSDPPHAAAPFSPAPIGAPRWDCLLWASTQPGSLLHAHKPLMCPAPFSSFAAFLLKTKRHHCTDTHTGRPGSLFKLCLWNTHLDFLCQTSYTSSARRCQWLDCCNEEKFVSVYVNVDHVMGSIWG